MLEGGDAKDVVRQDDTVMNGRVESSSSSNMNSNSNLCKIESSNPEVMEAPRQKKTNRKSFLQRTWRNVLKVRSRTSSNSSYDMGSDASGRSSFKGEFLSENGEEKSDGVDSGIASESSDGRASSILYSCTNFTGGSIGDRVPGICGIHNLGNTCYMNSVLQCLAHVDLVVHYFVMDKYRDDLKQKKRKLKSRKLDGSSKITMTESFAVLLKSLWSFGYSRELCQEFKDTVSKYGEQYSGTSQHDAQEFLLWLLDCIHVDLCKNTTWNFYNRSISLKKNKSYTEEELAARTLATYTQQNQSFIKSVFQAQYKSTLVCPNCNTCSSTFDPFLCISLPIPQKETKPIFLIMVYNSNAKAPRKIAVSVKLSGNVQELKSHLSKSVNIAVDRLVILLAYEDGDHSSLKDDVMVDGIPEMEDCLLALEIPEDSCVKSMPGVAVNNNNINNNDNNQVEPRKAEVDGLTANFKYRSSLIENKEAVQETIAIVVANVEIKGNHYRRFGFPIALRVSKDVSFRNLQILIRREMPTQIRSAINTEAKKWKLVLGLRVCGGIVNNEYLKEYEAAPLRHPTVDRAMKFNGTAGPPHLSLVAEWEPESTDWCLAKYGLGQAAEDSSVKILEEEYSKGQKVNLDDCFGLHTKEEELQYEDSWRCPCCKIELKKTTKKLCLWSLPDVLVIHLKRFQQANQWKGKISADISFPLYGLEMGSYVASRTKISPKLVRKYSTSKKHLYSHPPEPVDCIYDLFAVCNHIGPYITSGHYTAICKNSANGNWYCFDDSEVSSVTEEQVCTRSAYLLFYQKRNVVSRSVSSSSLSSVASHWSNQISVTQSSEECQR